MIKNVGTGAAESLIEERTANGPFTSMDDFCRRLNARNVNKRALESLIKAGAMDSIAGSSEARGSLLANLDRILSMAQSAQKLRETGQTTMFDLFGEEVATPLTSIDIESAPIPKSELLAWEKDLLGIWLSEHPLTHAAPLLAPHVTALCNEITPELLADVPPQGRDYVMGGIVGSSRRLATRDGRSFIAAEITDLSGTLEVTVWPDLYERTQDLWTTGSIVLMQVRVRERGERISAGVQEASGFTEDFTPPDWLKYVTMDVPAPGQRGRNGNGNGYRNGNGRSTSGGAAYSPMPRVADRVSEPAPSYDAPPPYEEPPPSAYESPVYESAPPPAEEPPSYDEPSAPPLPPVVTRPQPLRLQMEETEDEEGDQKRLAAVFNLLQQRPGADPVYLTIRTRDGDNFDLQLPSAALDEGLKQSLKEILSAPVPVA
jgi:DNA polymerase-3 subunit alpha